MIQNRHETKHGNKDKNSNIISEYFIFPVHRKRVFRVPTCLFGYAYLQNESGHSVTSTLRFKFVLVYPLSCEQKAKIFINNRTKVCKWL